VAKSTIKLEFAKMRIQKIFQSFISSLSKEGDRWLGVKINYVVANAFCVKNNKVTVEVAFSIYHSATH